MFIHSLLMWVIRLHDENKFCGKSFSLEIYFNLKYSNNAVAIVFSLFVFQTPKKTLHWKLNNAIIINIFGSLTFLQLMDVHLICNCNQKFNECIKYSHRIQIFN